MFSIFGGIDGTGEYSDREYEVTFSESFVNRLFQSWPGRMKTYTRGPNLDGASTKSKAENIAFEIIQHHDRFFGEKPKIFLSGYSRGGAAAIYAANLLKSKRMEVECMFLFDAVDRTLFLEADKIPSNVKKCYHAVRKDETGSRPTFGNCGMSAENPYTTTAVWEKFGCTHGGMGGVCRKNVKEDEYVYESSKTLQKLREQNFIDPKINIIILMVSGAERLAVKTNVTGRTDRDESAKVWEWMVGYVQKYLQ